MSLLKPLTDEVGYLKAGFLGKNKSGKTYTATLLACGVHKMFGSQKPIAFFDTEGGSPFVRQMIAKATGTEPIGIRSRSLSDLSSALRECEAGASDILLVDSITHPWRELCDSYMAQVNESLRRRGRGPRQRLEFQDWAIVKDKWGTEWATPYINARIHIIICGRAGDVYEYVENEDTGKKELRVTGTKMKTETEFGFEPSLLVEMEREQVTDEKGRRHIQHWATVIGDRFHIIDGKSANNPGFDFFLPHIELLRPGAHAPVDASLKTNFGVDDSGDADFVADRRRRAILCEEIQGLLTAFYPGQSKEEKKAKVDLIDTAFGTRSWTRVESLSEVQLAEGYDKLRALLEGASSSMPEDEDQDEGADTPNRHSPAVMADRPAAPDSDEN